MPWATRFLCDASNARFSHAEPASNMCVTDGFSLCSKFFRAMRMMMTAALFVQDWLNSPIRLNNLFQCSVSRFA